MEGDGLNPERWRVGHQRFDAFLDAQGQLHAESMSLTLMMGFSAAAGYSDDSLAAIERDCNDLEKAAAELVAVARRIAKEWHQQRVHGERRGG